MTDYTPTHPPSFHRCAFVCVLAIALTGLSAQSVLAETGVTNIINGVTTNYSGNTYKIGSDGVFNGLIVTNAGVLQGIGTGSIGSSSISSNNFAIVTGAGSIWSNTYGTVVGYTGSFNRLIVRDGAYVRAGLDSHIAWDVASIGNEILVTDTNSLFLGTSLHLGEGGSFNTLTIQNGALVRIASDAYLGGSSSSTGNVAVVTDPGSLWTNGSKLEVGSKGVGNILIVTNGGQVAASGFVIVGGGSSNNTILVTGAGSVLRNSGGSGILVGNEGSSNTLIVANAGSVVGVGYVGYTSFASNNQVLVTDPGSVWSGRITVGSQGDSNTLTVANGGSVISLSDCRIGSIGDSEGNTVLVTGIGSLWSNSADLYVGDGGKRNSLTIADGAQAVNGSGYLGNSSSSSNNVVLVGGTGSLWNNTNELYVGYGGPSNSLTIASGGIVTTPSLIAGFGSVSTGNVISVSGGSLFVTNSFGTGSFNLRHATLALNSGTVVVNRLYATNGASSVVNINGGSLTTPMLLNAGQFTMTGGTLSVSGAFTNAAGGTFNLSGGSALVPLEMNNMGTFIQSGGFFDPEVFTNSGSFALSGGTNIAEVFLNLLSGTVTQSGGEQDVNHATNFGSWTISGGVANLANFINEDHAALTVSGGILNGSLTIGNTGSFNRLTITNGGTVAGGFGVIGSAPLSSNNIGIVTGPGTLWTNTGNLIIGNDGSGNQLTIQDGGTVNNGSGYIGFSASSSNNTVLVTGTGSLWNNRSDLQIGCSGSANQLLIQSGGVVSNTFAAIGQNTSSSNNAVLISGTGSVWNSGMFLYAGYAGASNQLIIQSGGVVSNSLWIHVGDQASSSNNAVLVDGTGSALIGSTLVVGNWGAANRLTIQNGGVVSNVFGYIGFYASSSNNAVLISGAGSLWKNSSDLNIGSSGSGNKLTIQNGGVVSDSSGGIGCGTSSTNNTVVVTGTGSLWNNSGTFGLGLSDFANLNQLTIQNGGVVSNTSGTIGSWGNSNAVLVTGTGSLWKNGGSLTIGYAGSSNQLTIENGGVVSANFVRISDYFSANNNVALVSGTGSLLNISGDLNIGNFGFSNRLVIRSGGMVSNAIAFVGGGMSQDNAVLVTGTGSVWKNSSTLIIGNSNPGNQITITDGGMVCNAASYVGFAYGGSPFAANSNEVLVTGASSIWTNSGPLSIGYGGSDNSVTLATGGRIWASMLSNYSGGIFSLSGGSAYFPRVANAGVFNLRSGLFDMASFDNTGLFEVWNSLTVGAGAGLTNRDGGSVRLVSNATVSVSGSFVITNATLEFAGVSTNATPFLPGVTFQNGAGIKWTGYGGSFGDHAITGNLNLDLPSGSGLMRGIVDNASLSIGGGNGLLYVGSNKSVSLTLTNDAQVLNSIGYIGFDAASSNNSVSVSGPGSVWSNSGNLYVGVSGSDNSLTITNGGRVIAVSAYIGFATMSSNNIALVSGAGSVWNNSSSLSIGSSGSQNQLIISNGGTAISAGSSSYIGRFSNSTQNAVLVTGAGSVWSNNNSSLRVGAAGSSNQLTIADGGAVFSTNGSVGNDLRSHGNSVLVTGAGSIWSNSLSLAVGSNGYGNQLTIANGGAVFDTIGSIGNGYNAHSNSVRVTGAGSVWNNSGALFVGNDGRSNQLTITDGGAVFNSTGYVGYASSTLNSSVLVSGAGSVWSNSSYLYLGYYGTYGLLTITNGGTVFDTGYIGSAGSAVLVTGTSSLWNSSSNIIVTAGRGNNLVIADGGRVLSANSYVGYGSGNDTNTVLVTGPGSLWSNSGTLHVGYLGSTNILSITNGGTVQATNTVIGLTASTGNAIKVSGGNLYATNTAGTGALDIRYGALALNSGTVVVDHLYATNGANSSVNFNGGTLNSGGSTVNNGSIFAVGNGTSAANLHLLGGTHGFANGLFINTNSWLTGTGAITGVITNAGSIAPGDSPGILTVSGDLTLLTNSLLMMELAGTNDGFYDQINVSGALAFDGTLTLSLLDGFTVSAGNRFDLFDFSSSGGAFSQINLPGLTSLMYWDTSELYITGEVEADWMTGDLNITIEPAGARSAGAQWQVDGGAWQNSGNTVASLVIGEHTLAFKDVAGWITPTSRVVQVTFGAILLDTITYEKFTPVLLAAASSKTHSAAGAINLTLNLNPAVNPTVEPRKGGPAQLMFTFNKEMTAADGTLDASEFTLTNATYVSASILSSNLTLNLTNAVDQSKVTVVLNGLSDLAGNALVGTNAVKIRSLYGDANQSGTVNIADMQVIKFKLASAVSATNFLYDVNLNGLINIADMQVVKTQLSHTVPLNSVDSGVNSLVTFLSTALAATADSSASSVTLGEALGAPELLWNTDGDAVWTATMALDGSLMAWSGSIGHLNVSWVETTVTGPGTLSFQWKVSSEADADYLTFAMDGEDQPGRLSGEVDWQTLTFSIPSGTHRLTWTYAKDRANAAGLDAGWLRRVSFQPAP